MIQKLFLLATVLLVGCPVIAPLSGCNGDAAGTKPTIDMKSEFKVPVAPTVEKVEIKPKKSR